MSVEPVQLVQPVEPEEIEQPAPVAAAPVAAPQGPKNLLYQIMVCERNQRNRTKEWQPVWVQGILPKQ